MGALKDGALYLILQHIDADLAATTQAEGCVHCGGALHRACYPRKPRGGPGGLADLRRLSFCCAQEGCRSRHTPPSVRFLGRKVYWGVVVVLVTALRHGTTPARLACLREACGVSARTLARWRHWWQQTFAGSRFWTAAQGQLATPVAVERLPLSLLERYAGDGTQPLVSLLRFLAPITSGERAF